MPTYAIRGVNRDTGKEHHTVIEAQTEREATTRANDKGIVVASITLAHPPKPTIDPGTLPPEYRYLQNRDGLDLSTNHLLSMLLCRMDALERTQIMRRPGRTVGWPLFWTLIFWTAVLVLLNQWQPVITASRNAVEIVKPRGY